MATTRYTIDIDEKFAKTLDDLVSSTSASTKAEVIRNAVATYQYLTENAAKSPKSQIVIREEGKKGGKIIILPK